MRTKIYLFSLCLIGILLYSCDPNEVKNNRDNYWEKSDLVHMNIKGKVKTTTSNSGIVMSFNESGFISSIVINSEGSSPTSIYTYNANGQLAKIVYTSPNGSSQLITTTTYEYNNPGKYILKSTASIDLVGLIPNLSSATTVSTLYPEGNYAKFEYVFKDATTMFIVYSNSINSTVTKDSSTIQYNGNYPSEWSNQGVFYKDITYASNGMFKTYTKGYMGTSTKYSEVHTFKTNNDYLMPESLQEIFTDYATPSNNYSRTLTSTYNDNNDLIEISGDGSSFQFIYEYDSHGNWTSSTEKYKLKGATDWSTQNPNIRTIIYW
ncbi:MAG: hypothetical protein ACYC25_16240 [Paludibacter sp.]